MKVEIKLPPLQTSLGSQTRAPEITIDTLTVECGAFIPDGTGGVICFNFRNHHQQSAFTKGVKYEEVGTDTVAVFPHIIYAKIVEDPTEDNVVVEGMIGSLK